MNLGELICELKKHDAKKVVAIGFGKPNSYRGYYEDIAFEPAENVTIGSMLKFAKMANGKTFCGYKGGEYKMGEYTECWIAEYGTTKDAQQIGPTLLRLMFA